MRTSDQNCCKVPAKIELITISLEKAPVDTVLTTSLSSLKNSASFRLANYCGMSLMICVPFMISCPTSSKISLVSLKVIFILS